MSEPKTFLDIRVERRGAISVIFICRPELRNALRRKTLDEAHEAVRSEIESGARALIFTGEGEQAFSAGADLKEMSTYTPEMRLEFQENAWPQFFATLESSPIPVISAIRGYALGGGLELALACHIRIVGEGAKLGLPEIQRGHTPGSGGTVRLPRLVGNSLAIEHLLLGDHINAKEAVRIGLANAVVPDAEVLDKAVELASRIAAHSPNAVRLLLRSVMGGRDMSVDEALKHEVEMSKQMRASKDYAAGWGEFTRKRST